MCVCACVRVCVCACVRVCVRACVCRYNTSCTRTCLVFSGESGPVDTGIGVKHDGHHDTLGQQRFTIATVTTESAEFGVPRGDGTWVKARQCQATTECITQRCHRTFRVFFAKISSSRFAILISWTLHQMLCIDIFFTGNTAQLNLQ